MRNCQVYTLKNGIRVVFNRATNSRIVHCGMMLDVGSRDESLENQGIAHFWEHMAFKGTRKRKAFHIINRLESVGGELNAFTDKEKICFFAALRDEYFERAVDLLADITFNSEFPKNQLERERNVILEEMSMYYDDPDGALQDEFDSIIFANHPLGMNILGTEKTVRSFQKKNFRSFLDQNLDTSRIVFSVVGDLPWEEVIRLSEKYLGKIPTLKSKSNRKKFKGYQALTREIARPVKQGRCAIGRSAFSIKNEKRWQFYFLNNILGGPGMNSKLNMSLREKYGYVYSIGSHFAPFSDTGIFMISFGTEPSQMPKAINLVKGELSRMIDRPLGNRQLTTAKEQFLGQIAMAEENNSGFMMMMARTILDLGRVPPLEEIFQQVKTATSEDLRSLAEDMFDERELSVLTMKPEG